jgi:hypothetical protein
MRFLFAASSIALLALVASDAAATEGAGNSSVGEGEAARGIWHHPLAAPGIGYGRPGRSTTHPYFFAATSTPDERRRLVAASRRILGGWEQEANVLPDPIRYTPGRADAPNVIPIVSIERLHRPAFYSQRHRILVGWPGATTLEPGPPPTTLVVQFQPPLTSDALGAFSRFHQVTVLADYGNGRYVLRYDGRRPVQHVADDMKTEPKVINVEPVM